ncbi:MAG: hypothetical protein ACLTER_12825 [Ruminococcus sp.]
MVFAEDELFTNDRQKAKVTRHKTGRALDNENLWMAVFSACMQKSSDITAWDGTVRCEKKAH